MTPQTRKWLCMPALVAALAIGGLTGCEIDQTREGDLPSVDVDVDADSGQLPRFDIDGPDVNVGMTTKMVKVPKVVVVMEEEEIEVPYIDVDLPDHDETERTLAVEVQVPGEGFELDIEEATVVDGTLWVISELEAPEEAPAEGPAMRISDRIVVNAPELPVRHIIVGERPDGDYNDGHEFINDRTAIQAELDRGQALYTK